MSQVPSSDSVTRGLNSRNSFISHSLVVLPFSASPRDLRTPDRVPRPNAVLWSGLLSGVIPTDVLGLRDCAALLLREGVPALHLKVLGDAAAAARTRGGGGRAWPATRPVNRSGDKNILHLQK